jgi:hypothetical protein
MTGSNEPAAERNVLPSVPPAVVGKVGDPSTPAGRDFSKPIRACDGGILYLVFGGDEGEVPLAVLEKDRL